MVRADGTDHIEEMARAKSDGNSLTIGTQDIAIEDKRHETRMNNRIRKRLVGSEILRMKKVQQYNMVRALAQRLDWVPEITAIIEYDVSGQ